MFKRFAWFVWVVFTAKNISSKWIDVGFGVTVPASIVIRLSNSFVVTSFSHGNCVGVKFRCGNLSRSPVECCDLGATNIWKKGEKKQIENKKYIILLLILCIDNRFGTFVVIVVDFLCRLNNLCVSDDDHIRSALWQFHYTNSELWSWTLITHKRTIEWTNERMHTNQI